MLAPTLHPFRCGRRDCGPTFRDPRSFEAPEDEAVEFHFLLRASVRPTPDVAAHHLVALSDHVVDRHVQIRHRFVHFHHHLLIAVSICRIVAGPIMIIKLRSHVPLNDCGISPVYEILEMVPHDSS